MTLPVGRLHDFFSMSRVATIACAVVTGLLAAPTLSHAQTATIVGSLANFDVENETEDEQEGFQIELEGLELNDITRVFGKSGSTCFIRYCGGSVRSFSRPDGTFGVLVEWKATFDPIAQRFTTPPDAPGGGSSGTPSSFGAPLAPGVLTGEACWSLGSGAAYPTSGCEHFGVSTLRNPTKPPVYRWMKGDTATGIVAPDTVTTAAGAVVPAPPVAVQHPIANIVVDAKGIEQIEAVIEAPRPIDDIAPLANPRRFGKAEWVKVYKAEVPRQANLDELVGGHPNNVVPFAQPGVILPSCADVADDEPCVDMEWKLLQFDVTNQDNGSSALRSSTKSNSRSHAVIRRYEFYKYIAPVVAPGGTSGKKGERLSTDDQEQSNCLRSVPGDLTTECLSAPADEIGTFIGAQMAAQNIGPARRFAQTITGFTLPATLTFNDPPFTVSAAGGGSANPVLFAASGACTSTFGDPVITITGTGTCMVTASQDGDILFAAATPVTLTVNVEKATATVTFDAGTLSQTYSGSLKTVSATTAPVGLAVDVSITGTAQDAGDYPVTATINDDNYTGSASGTLTIAKADATFAISGFAGIYDGAAHAATGTATGVSAESLTALLNLGASFTNAPGGIANWTFAGDAK